MARMATSVFVLLLAGVFAAGCSEPTVDIERAKRIAGELRNNKLYAAAIQEYERILETPGLDDAQRGNLNYLIARIYFEDMDDYRNAAAYYVRARSYAPEASYAEEASRNLVAALEKMGQTLDAARELRASTDIEAEDAPPGDVVVARVGEDEIYMAEVEERIQSLPPETQEQLASRDARIEFVKQMAAMELLYRAAMREGYDRDPEIQRRIEELARQAIIDQFLVEKVMKDLPIDTLDVRTFYRANREDRYGGAPYDSVRAQVFFDYQQQKAEVAFNEYVQELAEAERFEILERNVR